MLVVVVGKKEKTRDEMRRRTSVHAVLVVRKDYHVVIPDRYIGSRRPNDGEQVDCIRDPNTIRRRRCSTCLTSLMLNLGPQSQSIAWAALLA